MRDRIRVLILGTGQMGSGIARLVLRKEGLKLVGAVARRAERAGLDLGPAIGLDQELGITLSTDLETAITATQPHVAIQATCSTVADASAEITMLVTHGIHVISIAEEMAYPAHRAPTAAEELHWLACSNGVAILGTGINPGFVLDTLIVTLTGICADVESIRARRVNDLSTYGPTVLSNQGVGLTPEAFRESVKEGSVVGHIGFPESIHLIASALGWQIDRIDENREPIVSRVQRATPFATVEPGHTAGCLHTAVAYRGTDAVISLIHPQQIRPELESVATGDTIEIRGTPDIRLESKPELPGGVGTIAIAVNVIPQVMNAAPGLHTMMDLPANPALLGDARKFVRRIPQEQDRG